MTRAAIRRLVTPLAIAVVATACGVSSDEAAPRELVLVETSTPEPLMVPGEAPDGFLPSEATVLDPEQHDQSRFVLFGETTGELMDGKQLVAGTFFGSAGDAFGEGCNLTFGEARQCGTWTVAQRDHEGCISDCYAFVLGRNASVDEVQAAADAMTFDDLTPEIPGDALPQGVVPLVDAPMAVHELRGPGTQVVTYSATNGRRLSVTAVDGGEALADLWRFFVDDDGHTAPFDLWSGSPAVGAIRVDGPTAIAVLGGGLSVTEVERFADSVHRDSSGEWEQLRAEVGELPIDRLLPSGAGETFVATVEGEASDGRWMVGYVKSPQGALYQVTAFAGPDPDDRIEGGGGPFDPGDPSTVSVFGGMESSAGGTTHILRTGCAPAEAAVVEVMFDDGSIVAASVGEPSDLDDVGVERSPSMPVTVVAYNVAGKEIGRASTPD